MRKGLPTLIFTSHHVAHKRQEQNPKRNGFHMEGRSGQAEERWSTWEGWGLEEVGQGPRNNWKKWTQAGRCDD